MKILWQNKIDLRKNNNDFSQKANLKKQNRQNFLAEKMDSDLNNIAFLNKNFISFGVFINPNNEYHKKVREIFHDLKPNITPDKYQLAAAESIKKGNSTLVTAPTGTGKTLIAEFAMFDNLQNNKKTFYTTPLKALSNQKYKDFSDLYGKENVGIMTGDIKENTNAPIVVMTTEIYHNMLKPNITEEEQVVMKDLKTVILDEFHYMNDYDRGSVWEESIMYSPKDVQLIPLSATVSNAESITEWMQELNSSKMVTLINVPPSERHVPLKFQEFSYDKGLLPLFSQKINMQKLYKAIKNPESNERTIKALVELGDILGPKDEESSHDKGLEVIYNIFGYEKQNIYTTEFVAALNEKGLDTEEAEKMSLVLANTDVVPKNFSPKIMSSGKDEKIAKKIIEPNLINALLSTLSHTKKAQNDIPAIVFVFSRKDCCDLADKYSANITSTQSRHKRKVAARMEKCDEIEKYIEKAQKENGILGFEFDEKAKKQLLNGVGVHHAGMLPAYKTLVENLFNARLLDVVFSTETLAAGINMPAKTTVLTSLSKPCKSEQDRKTIRRYLTTSEFAQMSGRAGRRGIDEIGNVVVLVADDFDEEKATMLATSPADKIQSKFNISYGFVTDLIKQSSGLFSKEKANAFFDKSFLLHTSTNGDYQKEFLLKKSNKLKDILMDKNYMSKLDERNYELNLGGELVSKVRGTNELFLTDLIIDGTLSDLSPEVMAACVSSFANDRISSINDDYSDDIVSYPVLSPIINSMKKTAQDINKLEEYKLGHANVKPVNVDSDFADATYSWLISTNDDDTERWDNAVSTMKDMGLIKFEGDFFKSLNMTVDILNQISALSSMAQKYTNNPQKKKALQEQEETARKAVELMNRPPLQLKY